MPGEERVHQRRENSVDDVVPYPAKGIAATPPRGYRPLPEEYVEGQQGVHVHLRVEPLSESGVTGRIGRNLCAVFKRTQVDIDGPGQVGRVGNVSPCADSHLGNVRRSMLVHVGKLVQHPEGVRRELIPSIVRLQSLDDCLRSWVDAPDFVATFPHQPVLVAKDGKLRPPIEGVGQGAASVVRDREFVGEVVERGAEVVETVADDEAELWRDWIGESDVHELLAALTVDMTVVSVRVSVSPLTNLRLKTVQVAGGPA